MSTDRPTAGETHEFVPHAADSGERDCTLWRRCHYTGSAGLCGLDVDVPIHLSRFHTVCPCGQRSHDTEAVHDLVCPDATRQPATEAGPWISQEIEAGKYKFVFDADGLRILRYGQPWREHTGDNALLCLMQALAASQARVGELETVVESKQRAFSITTDRLIDAEAKLAEWKRLTESAQAMVEEEIGRRGLAESESTRLRDRVGELEAAIQASEDDPLIAQLNSAESEVERLRAEVEAKERAFEVAVEQTQAVQRDLGEAIERERSTEIARQHYAARADKAEAQLAEVGSDRDRLNEHISECQAALSAMGVQPGADGSLLVGLARLADQLAEVRGELAACPRAAYRVMCRDRHEEIGYDSDDESCPLCLALAELEEANRTAESARDEVLAATKPLEDQVTSLQADKAAALVVIEYQKNPWNVKPEAYAEAKRRLGL